MDIVMNFLRAVMCVFCMFLYLTGGVTYAQSSAKESYDKGVEYTIQGKFKKAKEEFEKALKVDQFYSPAKLSLETIKDVIEQKIKRETAIHLFKGISHGNKGQLDRAISEYTKALEINPKDAKAYIYRGGAYLGKGQYDQAISEYTKALEINPKDALAYYNRGFVYRDKGQYDEAISDYTKVLEINPKDAGAYDSRGFTYLVKLGNKVKGCADWKKACDLGKCKNYNLAKQKGYCP